MIIYETNYLAHHGVLGMKWGVRRYQNKDGSYTAAGRKRYGYGEYDNSKIRKIARKYGKKLERADKETTKIMDARVRNRAKLETRYNNKISKAKLKKQTPKNEAKIQALQAKKRGVLKDFDDGTRYVSKGQERYSDIISKYKDAKIKAFESEAYKYSDAYKKAVNDYVNQELLSKTSYGGKSYTQLLYAHEEAVNDYKKRGIY